MGLPHYHALFYATAGLMVGTALGYYLSRPVVKRKKRRELFPKKTESDLDTLSLDSFAGRNSGSFDSRVGFLTGLCTQLWEYINPAASAKIRAMLSKTFKVIKIDLGSAPLRFDHVTVHEINRQDGFVQYDMDVLWDGECEMLFQAAKVGKFGIRALKLKGRMSIILKPLTTEWLPCFRAMSYAFINQPELELTFTGLALLTEFSYIDKTVRKILNDALASMVVLPYRLIYRIDEDASLMDIYQPPNGIARLTLENAKGFQIDKKSFGPDDIPDVYCTISFGEANIQTETIVSSFNPVWNFTADFMVFDLDQTFAINARDANADTVDADGDLGITHATVREILLSKDRRMDLPLFDKESGSFTGAFINVRCDLTPLVSVANARIPESLSDHQLVGVLAVLVRQAFDIPLPATKAATMVKVRAGQSEFFTGIVKDASGYDAVNPLYDCVFHIPISTEKPDIEFTLIQEKNKILGSHTVAFADVLKAPTIHRQNQAIGKDGAKLEFSVQLMTVEGIDSSAPIPSRSNSPPRLRPTFSAVNKSAASSSCDNSREPSPPESIEVRKIRVTAVRGKGFQARKRFLQREDTPDVYLKIFFEDGSPWRTSTACNATTPSWDESKVYTFVSYSEYFRIEAWHQNATRLGRDDIYGTTSASINKILLDGGTSDLELECNGQKTGLYITLSVSLLD